MIKKYGIYFLISIIVLSTPLLFSQEAEARTLENIGFKKIGNRIEVSIEYKGDVDFESFMLFGPNRLAVDLSGIEKISSPLNVDVNEMGITSIRSAVYSPGVVRVVLDFSDEIPRYKIEDFEKGLKIYFWKEAKTDSIPVEDVEVLDKEAVIEEPEQPKPASLLPKTLPQEEEKEVEKDDPVKTDDEMRKVGVGLSVGYLSLQDDVFQEVYGKGGIYYNAELSFVLPFSTKYLDVWAGVSQIQVDGKSTAFDENTRLKITVFSMAVRYLIKPAKLTPFFGLGLDYYSYKETLPEGFVVDSIGGYDLGFHFQGGVYLRLTPGLFAKILVKYNVAETTENGIDVDLGGMEYALGMIYRFNLERE